MRYQQHSMPPMAKRRGSAIVIQLALASLVTISISFPLNEARAQSASEAIAQTHVHFNVPAGPLAGALNLLADQANILLSVSGALTNGKQSPGVHGKQTLQTALRVALEGSGLEAVHHAGSWSVRKIQATDIQSVLPAVTVIATTSPESALPAYAGGQVARGGRMGLLGKRDMFDTPHSIVSFTDTLIENQQARTVSDTIKNDGSVRLGRTGQSSSFDSVFYIRGFFGTTQDMAFDGLFGLNSRGISTDQMAYIEILKGPSGFINGRPGNSVGGTINMVPKRADDVPLNSVTARYTSKNILGAHVDFGRRFGEDNAWGLRVNASKDSGDTAVKPARNSQTNLSASLDYRSRRLTASLDVDHGETRINGFSSGILFNSGIQIPAAPDASRLIAQPWNFNDLTSNRAVLRAQYEFADDWFIGGAYGKNEIDNPNLECRTTLTTSAGGYNQSCNVAGSDSKASSGELSVRGRIRSGEVEHLLSASVTDSSNQVGTAGTVTFANYSGSIYAPVLVSKPSIPAMPFVGKTSQTRLTSAGVGYELVMLKGDLRMLLGLRDVKIDTQNLNRNTGAQTSTYVSSAVTPSAGLVYKPTSNISVYGNYAEALEQGVAVPAGLQNTNQILGPLRSRQVEVGAKVDLGKLAFTMAMFEINKGLQYVEANRYVQDGKQVHRGIELGLFGEASSNLRLLSSLQFLDPKATRTANGQYDGMRPVGVPKFQAKAYLEWDQAYLPGFTLSGGLEHLSGQYVNAANTQSLPGWTRFDFGARYVTRWDNLPLTVRLNIENVFDKSYWAAIDRTQLYLGSPRLLSLSMNLKF